MLDVDREEWLHMYEQMFKIRTFEEHVNELYQSARMPGLAHLYIGEEAIAVGVCEALHRDDYITSTHRGHGHCPDAPVKRIGAMNVPIPFSPVLEDLTIPNAQVVCETARSLCGKN